MRRTAGRLTATTTRPTTATTILASAWCSSRSSEANRMSAFEQTDDPAPGRRAKMKVMMPAIGRTCRSEPFRRSRVLIFWLPILSMRSGRHISACAETEFSIAFCSTAALLSFAGQLFFFHSGCFAVICPRHNAIRSEIGGVVGMVDRVMSEKKNAINVY